MAQPEDPNPRLSLTWDQPSSIGRIELSFDTDFDHPMESVLLGHPEREMPFCVGSYRILNAEGAVVHECAGNHQTRNTVLLDPPVLTSRLTLEIVSTHGAPAAVFDLRCYGA